MARIKQAKRLTDLPLNRRHVAIMDDIRSPTQTDRGVAVIGAAYVDLALLESIRGHMPRPHQDVTNEFFGRALQNFGPRIQLGYLLGIYADGIYGDLCAIKDIRNAFAHSADALDFARADIAKLADSLTAPKRVQLRGLETPTTPRARYVHAVEIISDLLLSDLLLHARGMQGESVLQMKGARSES